MNKRTFLKSIGLGLGALAISDQTVKAVSEAAGAVKSLLKAKVLKEGDTIGIITPAGALSEEETIRMTKEVLAYFGFKVKEGKYIRFGKCTNCGPSGGYGALTLEQMLNDYIKPLGIPAYRGAMIGHISDQFLMPVGVRARMDATNGTIEYLEKSLL